MHVFTYYRIVGKFCLVQIFINLVDRPAFRKIRNDLQCSRASQPTFKILIESLLQLQNSVLCTSLTVSDLLKESSFSTYMALEKPDKCMATFKDLLMCFDTKIPEFQLLTRLAEESTSAKNVSLISSLCEAIVRHLGHVTTCEYPQNCTNAFCTSENFLHYVHSV